MLITHHLTSLFPPKGISSETYFKTIEQVHIRRFDGFLATSDFTRNYLVRNGIPREKIYVCPPGIEPLTIEAKSSGQVFRAIIVANVIERKGILPFLKALAKEMDESDLFQLTICGSLEMDLAYAEQCLSVIKENVQLAANIHFLGAVPQARVFELYAQSDVLISASFMETFGMAIQEANALGLPMFLLEGGNSTMHQTEANDVEIFNRIDILVRHFLDASRKFGHDELFKKRKKTTYLSWADAAQQFLTEFDYRYSNGKKS